MSARENLRDHVDGRPVAPTAGELCAALTEQLGLADLGLTVTGADVFGRGTSAVVDVRLSGALPIGLTAIRFGRFGDITQATKLAAEVVTQTGIYRKFSGQEAGQIAAAIVRLAKHRAEAVEDEAAVEWGAEYLRVAPVLTVDLDDQADRWRAFQSLARMNPARDAGEDRSAEALAAASTVLEDTTGRRLVRCGWFQAFVKRETGGIYSPQALTTQMERAGWKRPNSQGKVKATPPPAERAVARPTPSGGRPLSFRFYVVPADWPDPAVTAGGASYARGVASRAHVMDTCGNPVTAADHPDDPDVDRAERIAARNGHLDGAS